MSTTYDSRTDALESIYSGADALFIDHQDRPRLDQIVEKFRKIGGYAEFDDDFKTWPGIKGLEMSSTLLKILINVKDHGKIPGWYNNSLLDYSEPRAFKLPVPCEATAVDNDFNRRAALITNRSFRLGLYYFTHKSPLIEYVDTKVTEQPSVVARYDNASGVNRVLVGQRVTDGVQPVLNLGSYGGEEDGVTNHAFAVYDLAEDKSAILAKPALESIIY